MRKAYGGHKVLPGIISGVHRRWKSSANHVPRATRQKFDPEPMTYSVPHSHREEADGSSTLIKSTCLLHSTGIPPPPLVKSNGKQFFPRVNSLGLLSFADGSLGRAQKLWNQNARRQESHNIVKSWKS